VLLPGTWTLILFTGEILLKKLKKDPLNNPKVSIITVCYNSGKTIFDTLKSVTAQKYVNIEYCIIDGGSSDNTIEIIKTFNNQNIKFISENDNGLYDALNKGIKMATGDIVGILHSDDFYPHENVISDIVAVFRSENPDAVSSSVNIYKEGQFAKPFRVYKATKFRPWQFRMGMQPPHPGFFLTKAALDKVGGFNTRYRISADFDWLLRVIAVSKARVIYTDYVSVHMRDGGISSSGINSKILMNKENLEILRTHKIKSSLLWIYCKYFLKIFQIKI
jgi:glycosyltransferase involved in cell wall biosynthesis